VDFSHLHFAQPVWLWGGVVIPLVWIIFFLFDVKRRPFHQLEKFVDKHLLPYLLVNNSDQKSSLWKMILLWSTVWLCLNLAMAGPRWNFREIETFSRDQSLVIALDLSESMNATDIKPSRLVRAKQKIEDLINLSKDVKIGLIAFAADSHMITPITEDKETIRHLLPSLETDLAYVQGSRLSSALDMAFTMLEAEPGNNKALLIMSDGGFEDASAITSAKKLAARGIVIHVMGIGTAEGASLRDHKGNIIKKNGSPIFSKLEKEMLSEISKVGNGRYLEVHYSDHEEALILKDLEKYAETQMNRGKKNRLWDEHFYLFILPVLPIILWWFRRGYVVAMFLVLLTPAFKINAMTIENYFKNSEELGKQALDEGDYETASHTFHDIYRKGVAYYKAGHFAEAEKMFRQSSREDVASHAAYNLGNTLVQQQKFKEAIAVYEDLLKKSPDYTKAKDNLELVKKILEQQKQENSQSENSNQQEKQDSHESEEKNNSEKQDSKDKDEAEKEDKSEKQDSEGKGESKEKNKIENQDSKNKNDNEKEDDSESEESNHLEDKEQHRDKEQQNNREDGDEGQKEQHAVAEETDGSQNENGEAKTLKSQEDQDADLWFNRIANDPKIFLKNKFYIESKRNETKEGIDPW
jgi:Ca-activated chloride channel family protein